MKLNLNYQAKRYSAETEGLIIEATIVEDNNGSRIEGGTVRKSDDSSQLASFSDYNEGVSYNIYSSDREVRQLIINTVDDFMAVLRNNIKEGKA